MIIEGKTMVGGLENIKNVDAPGEYIITDDGTSQYTRSRWRGGFKRYHQRKWDSKIAYHDEERKAITLSVASKQENTAYVSDSHDKRPTDVGLVHSVNAVGNQSGEPNVINSTQANTRLPNSSLFSIDPNSHNYLVETDPRFTNGRQWLGSDYMLKMVGANPAYMHKRLGDGYYEQRLINEQVAQLTGQRYLGAYENDEEQFKALMNNGATFARAHNLVPGVSLSKEMVAQLTSDIVWLETQTVTLADGRIQSVLVPKVYVRARKGDLSNSGALISAKDMQLNVSGNLDNGGTIAGRNIVSLSAQNINNMGGRIQGAQVQLQTGEDVNIVGGSIVAQKSLAIDAGRDINIQTTTNSTTQEDHGFSGGRTSIDRVAGLYVTEEAGILLAQSGRDINLAAANISNIGADGQTYVLAGNDLNIGTVTTSRRESSVQDAKNYRIQENTEEVGSQLNSQGNMTLQAQGQLTATASAINSQEGHLSILGQKGVTIQSGLATDKFDEGRYHNDRGSLVSKSREVRYSDDNTRAIGSDVTGQSVQIHSAQDLNIKGSHVVADNGLTLSADQKISIEAAEEIHRHEQFHETKKSGLMGSGGIGVTIGSQKQSTDQENTATSSSASMVGSLNGDVNINAGGNYEQTGSYLLSPSGDISVSAKDIKVQEAREQQNSKFVQKMESSGLTLAWTGGVISMAESVADHATKTVKSDSNRNKTLHLLSAYAKGSSLYEAGSATVGNLSNAKDAATASGIKVSISYGTSKNENQSTSVTNQGVGSVVKAGGDVRLNTTEKDITVQGSNIQAERDITLGAKSDILLQAGADTEQTRSNNKSSSNSLGVSIGVGSGGLGVSLDVAMSRGKGQANSDSTTWQNTEIQAGQNITMTSGGDAKLYGSNVSANKIEADIGGNLDIRSLQDTAVSNSKQQTSGISVSIPIYGAGGFSGSISNSRQKSDLNYNSVFQQTGISVGDGGFDIRVQGNTNLEGAYISSDAQAELNQLSTASLTTSDIHNEMSASASSRGISVGTDMFNNSWELTKAVGSNLMNHGSASSHDSSDTLSSISAAQVTVNGVTTQTNQEQLFDSNGKAIITDKLKHHRALVKTDISELQDQAQTKQDNNMLLVNTIIDLADNGMTKKMDPKLYQVFCLEERCANDQEKNNQVLNDIAKDIMDNNPGMTEKEASKQALALVVGKKGDGRNANPEYALYDPNRYIFADKNPSEIKNIQALPVSIDDLKKLTNEKKQDSSVFGNGIFNPLQRAAELAIQQTPKWDMGTAEGYQQAMAQGTVLKGDTYLVHTDQANNSIGEMIVAGVTKVGDVLGIQSPSSKLKNKVIIELSTNHATGLTDNRVNPISHSRDTMEQSIGTAALVKMGFKNPNLKYYVNNPAANEARFIKRARQVTDAKNIHIWAPSDDPVATFVGGYGYDYWNSIKSLPKIFAGSNSVHSSPGSGAFGSETNHVPRPISYPKDEKALEHLQEQHRENMKDVYKQVLDKPKQIPIAPQADTNRQLQEEVQQQSNEDMRQLNRSEGQGLKPIVVPTSTLQKVQQLQKYLH